MIKKRMCAWVWAVLFSCAMFPQRQRMDLQGKWAFKLDVRGNGEESGFATAPFAEEVMLPGTTDTNRKGFRPARTDETTYLTRLHAYVGKAWYKKVVDIPESWKNKVVTLTLERTKPTRVWVDGKEAGSRDGISVRQVYDLSRFLTPGRHEIAVRVDNGESVPPELLGSSHAYTESTQTNWNGIIGDIFLEAKEPLHLAGVQVYPDAEKKSVRLKVRLASPEDIRNRMQLEVHATAWNTKKEHRVRPLKFGLEKGQAEYDFDFPLGEEALLWSEYDPALYRLEVELPGYDRLSVDFGLRDFRAEGKHFAINGMTTFLRGKHDACVFPLTGHTAMDVETWRHYFRVAKSYGINHYRFHSWCPPEAAFQVADSLGFYLQVELPLWSVKVGEDSHTNDFLYAEADRILAEYGNHPSFCFFSLGNELQPDFEFLSRLLKHTKEQDPRHLYTTTSFTFERGHGDWPEPDDDFFITQWTKKGWVRGQGVFDSQSPSFDKDYIASVEGMNVPLVTHEIGQYSVFPNLKEIDKYTGVLDPLNFKGVKQELEKKGLLNKADDYLKASGYLAAILYKEEIERAMKTAGCSGFQLLDLHDFPGQGTALVGLLDAFWDSKGVTDAETFRQACSPVTPLVRFPKAVYTSGESFTASVEVANFTDKELKDQSVSWILKDEKGKEIGKGMMSCPSLSIGLNRLPEAITCPLAQQEAARLLLSVALDNTPYKNEWSIWVYPSQLNPVKDDVVVTRDLRETQKALAYGKKVLYNPDYKKIEGLEGKFVPVFWSPVHFPKQAGSMGILCDASHPAFAHFPTGNYTDWQWWSLLKQSKTIVMDTLPSVTPLVEVVDNFANNRRLSNLFEAKVGEGKLLFCSMDILSDWEQRPEARQLYFSLLEYMKSDSFDPSSAMESDVLVQLFKSGLSSGASNPEDIY